MIQIRKRVMVIPKIERYIGTVDDNNAESRMFRIDRYTDTQADLSALSFRMITIDENGRENAIYLEKEVSRNYIDLTWTLIESDVVNSGTLLCQLKAFDNGGMVKWHSFPAAFYVTENLNTPNIESKLSDYERVVVKIDGLKDEITDGLIDTMGITADGYLTVTYKDGHEQKFYVKGDPPSEEDIIAAASSIGTNIQGLINEVTTLAGQISSSIERAERAAENAEAAARGEKVSGTVTFDKDAWSEDDGWQQSISTTVFDGKDNSDFVCTVVLGTHPVEEKKAFGCIDKVEVLSGGTVLATCFSKKPAETITIYLREV